jgi:hypothetical protein
VIKRSEKFIIQIQLENKISEESDKDDQIKKSLIKDTFENKLKDESDKDKQIIISKETTLRIY